MVIAGYKTANVTPVLILADVIGYLGGISSTAVGSQSYRLQPIHGKITRLYTRHCTVVFCFA